MQPKKYSLTTYELRTSSSGIFSSRPWKKLNCTAEYTYTVELNCTVEFNESL